MLRKELLNPSTLHNKTLPLLPGTGVTSHAVKDWESNLSMAATTKLPLHDTLHGDGICTLFHRKQNRMAVITPEPQGVRLMGEDHIGYRVCVIYFKNNV